MHEGKAIQPLSGRAVAGRFAVLLALAAGAGLAARAALGLDAAQTWSVATFMMTVLATLFFWSIRLAIVFLGIAVLLFTRSLNLEQFVLSSSLEVILFLVGMMVVVAAARDLGLFTWVVQGILKMKGMTGPRFLAITCLVAALSACLVDEVTSIIFVAALIFQVCDLLKVRAAPFLIAAVMATNVGSAGTMLGNPVGIFLGRKAGLTFEDFMVWAFPAMLASLAVTTALILVWYRKDVALLSEKLEERRRKGLGLGPIAAVSPWKGAAVLGGTLAFVAAHHRIETALGLEKNTVLLVAPLVAAAVVMIWRRERARAYIDREVDWWTLTFFLMLFAVSGTLEYTGVTGRMASSFGRLLGGGHAILVPVVMLMSAAGSAFVDNVVFVAAFVPVVKGLTAGVAGPHPLWWALLFGACFGGNITAIGSTANIVALGMIEKRYRERVRFLEWFKVGLATGLAACLVAWGVLEVTTALLGGAG